MIQIKLKPPEFFPYFSQITLTHKRLQHKRLYNKDKRGINCKPVNGGEMKRLDDGQFESLFLKFKQLYQGCFSGKIHKLFFFGSTHGIRCC